MENLTDKVQNIKPNKNKWKLSYIDTQIQYKQNIKNSKKKSF